MKKVYSTFMMLAMIVTALGMMSCSKEDDDKIDDGDYDDTEYCEIVINGEEYKPDFYGGGILANLASREKNISPLACARRLSLLALARLTGSYFTPCSLGITNSLILSGYLCMYS